MNGDKRKQRVKLKKAKRKVTIKRRVKTYAKRNIRMCYNISEIRSVA